MRSFWHNDVFGIYNPEDKWAGLDYAKLFFDPLQAELTYFHEIVHGTLTHTTDFGQATETIYQILPYVRKLTPDQKEQIKAALYQAQRFVQEGTATLMEILWLKSKRGKPFALNWAKQNLHPLYYEFFTKFLFVTEMSGYYRDSFTMKIPHHAMHTGIRKHIVELDLLSDPDKLIEYLKDPQHNPDARLNLFIDTIKYKPFLPTKDLEEICSRSGVSYMPDFPKEDAANFINYLHQLADNPVRITAADITAPKEGADALLQVSENMIVADMNINLPANATTLWEIKDLLHYADQLEIVFINRFGEEQWRTELEQLTGRKYEAGLIAKTRTGEKYIIGMPIQSASQLVNKEFGAATLIVKWGLYKPGDRELRYFPDSKKPNVTIYNNTDNLTENFDPYFNNGANAHYILIGVQNHPFQTLVLKDQDNVLHLVNMYGNVKIAAFLTRFRDHLVRTDPTIFLPDPRHFNRAYSFWTGLPQEINWYETFLNGGRQTIFNKKM